MNMKAILFSLFLLLHAGFAAAQNSNQAAKDSLRKAIIAQEGVKKLRSFLDLAIIYYGEVRDKQSLDSLIAIYDEIDREAEKQGKLKTRGVIRVNILGAMSNVQMFDEMISRAPEYLSFLKENEVWEHYFIVSGKLLDAYTERGEPEKALAEAQRFYAEAQELQNKQGMASVLYSMSRIYDSQRRFEESVEHLRKVIELIQGEDMLLFLLSNVYDNLCGALLILNRYDEALIHLAEYEEINKRYEAYVKGPVPTAWGNLWCIYAKLYLKTGKYDLSETYCNKIDSLTGPLYRESTYYYRTQILIARKQYEEALSMNDKAMELSTNPTSINADRGLRIEILAKMGRVEESLELVKVAAAVNDSIRNLQFNAQLDELRTRYEVDRHIAEKKRNRNSFIFAFGACILLAIALGTWMYYNRKIARKNRILVQQIKILTEQQKLRDDELLNKTSFVDNDENLPANEKDEADAEPENDEFLCPESRKDKLCRDIRDFILRDKAYRNPNINRDYVIERLGTNRDLFIEAFMYCFGMSFPEYINSLRLKEAIILLEQSDLPIEKIAKTTGFGSIRTFQRQFHAKYSISPKDFRDAAKN